MNMESLKKLKIALNIPLNIDIIAAWVLHKTKVFGHHYRYGKTISWQLGAEEAEHLYKEWIKTKQIPTEFPYIDLRDHPFGQFAEDICYAIQPGHGLITFLHDTSALEKKYPGITEVVRSYLKSKGIKGE